MALTEQQVAALEIKNKDYKVSDEKGLQLLVKANGKKFWRLRYWIASKEKTLSLGKYPEVTLNDARAEQQEALALLARGVDPSLNRQLKKTISPHAELDSFEGVSREWFCVRMGNKSATHQKRTQSILDNHLLPVLGRYTISELTPVMVLEALRRIEKTGAIETAHRAKNIASLIFRFGIVTERCERDPADALRGALQIAKKSHHAAIVDPKELGMFLRALDDSRGCFQVAAALKLAVLFFCRPGELCSLRWEFINFDKRLIEFNASKTNQPHIIPICEQALVILRELQSIAAGSPFVFASPRAKTRPISMDALRVRMRGMGFSKDEVTTHGFRATARTLLDEELGYSSDWIEHQLAHTVRDPNGRAYNRTKHLPQRIEMMQGWADYLDRLKSGSIK
ncbi:hypothetical protein WG68_08690 [Arsukibacterium ikkense]|uniref:Tyr recombinase domain-containing protein n=1 Tax=Arsukibacterium ikkense TaxID=336831 RepID=A0A0M2V9D5_9GAMM|nr:integrase arm-type DNA-binding domain-containing protein [Arsukibacterium ikkense]KKO45783.1 hypothetical protein WG68_08690 [Arsukibacterium ikkense]